MRKVLFNSVLLLGLLAGSGAVSAGGSVQHVSQASAHAAASVAHAAVAGVQVSVGVAAVPLMVSGEAGELVGNVGQQLWDDAQTPIGKPLTITGETYRSAPPPDEAMATTGAKP